MRSRWRALPAALLLMSSVAAAAPASGRQVEIPVSGRVDDLELRDVDGDQIKDLVFSHHEGHHRYLSWVAGGGNQTSARSAPVPPGAALAVIADLLPAAGPEIIFMERDRLTARSLRDPGVAPVTLAEQLYFFDLPGRRLPLADLAADLDGDGREDLVLPTPDGYSLLMASDPAHPQRLPGPVRQWMGESIMDDSFLDVTWTLPKAAATDLDGDGKSELVYFLDQSIAVARGAGGTAPTGFSSQDAAQLGAATESGRDASLSRRRMTIADIDGDGRADFLTSTTAGKLTQLSSWGTRVAVFLSAEGGRVGAKPATLVKVNGVSIPPRLVDIDGDRDLDLILSTIRIDLATGISAATLKKLTVTYEVYPWESGGFARRPQVQRDIDVPLEDFGDGVVPIGYLHGDYDGDGKRDLLVLGDGKFDIHRGGVKSGGFFSASDGFDQQPTWTITAAVSNSVEIDDLNGDGKSEVIFFGRDKITIFYPEGLR